jgi:ribosomal protein S18 acetylase RimI-like enzyme
MTVVIRFGAVPDASPLAELAARTFHETFAADNRPEDMSAHLASTYGPAIQRQELADPDITTLVVEIDGQLSGYAQLRSGETPECVEGDAPLELWRFYIGRDWHGRGVAHSLMQRVETEALRRGGRTLWLGVWERNERAKAFYRKHDFHDVGSHIYMVGTDAQTDRIFVRYVEPTLHNTHDASKETSHHA